MVGVAAIGHEQAFDAAERGDTPTVARILDCKGNVNARDVDGSALVHAAGEEGHVATLALLLDRGADIQARNNHQDTALHTAALAVDSWPAPAC